MRNSSRLSAMLRPSKFISTSWLTVSKNLARSMSTAMLLPSFTIACTCLIAWCALRPGRKPKLEFENVGSNIGVSTWATACWMTRSMTVGIPNMRLPPPCLGISTLRTACGWYRPSLICCRIADQCARMGGEVVKGHAVNARRAFVGLHPFPCLRQVVAGQHVLKQFCCHFHFVLFQGSVRVGRRPHLTRSGLIDLVEVFTSAPCVSLFGPSVPRLLGTYYGRC